MKANLPAVFGATLMAAIMLSGCSGGSSTPEPTTPTTGGNKPAATSDLKGEITIDGSSTVFKISQAMAEEFMTANKGVDVKVNESGTGGGFKKFVAGEIDICGASRPIEKEELDKANANKIEFVELEVAIDGLSIVVNPANTWAESLTIEELKKMWEPTSKINNWKDIRAGFPDKPLKLYGPGSDSGTFDYFTEVVVGKKKASRTDYTGSEDDNVLVTGVAGDEGGLGYFGHAYYEANKDKLKIVKIDAGQGPIEPTMETIGNGTYTPLSRPLFIYVTKKMLETPAGKAFVEFYLSEGNQPLIKETGYVNMPSDQMAECRKKLAELQTGSSITK